MSRTRWFSDGNEGFGKVLKRAEESAIKWTVSDHPSPLERVIAELERSIKDAPNKLNARWRENPDEMKEWQEGVEFALRRLRWLKEGRYG